MIIPFPAATVIAQAGPGLPQPAPAPATGAGQKAPPDPNVIAKNAQALLQEMQTGKVDRSTLDAKMNASLSDAQLSQIQGQLGPLGNPTGFTSQGKETQDGLTVYTYTVDFKAGSLTETYVVDSSGKVAGLWFNPASGSSSSPSSSSASSSSGTPPR
jgi:hypothetical protein